ncbi:MAG: fructosamine kinase family protein [Thiotrichaceae bacterium]|nr:fructosamine kinase family protein [Thiotrichaceae bacterium]
MAIDWAQIADIVYQKTGQYFVFSHPQSLSGGCINQAWQLSDQKGHLWFIKTNQASLLPMFEAEAEGLLAIQNTHSLRTPKVQCTGRTENLSFLMMEYIELSGTLNPRHLGQQLATMHAIEQDHFGWQCNNTIGLTQQVNPPETSWSHFWQYYRLQYQLELTINNGFSSSTYDKGMRLAEQTHLFFTNYQPIPSLLHGDLWAGNCAADQNNLSITFDPACYYGDREADLAMTELFGGFGKNFKSAYHHHYPIDQGYKTRKTLYNLYHILNHYNLFGGGYEGQAEKMITQLLIEC